MKSGRDKSKKNIKIILVLTVTVIVLAVIYIFRDPKENELYFNVGKNAMCVFLTAEYEDGSTVGITGDADWRSEDPSVAAVRDGGIEVVGAGADVEEDPSFI